VRLRSRKGVARRSWEKSKKNSGSVTSKGIAQRAIVKGREWEDMRSNNHEKKKETLGKLTYNEIGDSFRGRIWPLKCRKGKLKRTKRKAKKKK